MERKAANQHAFRRANERISEAAAGVADAVDGAPVPFLCECPQPGCGVVLRVTLSEYAAVRQNPRHAIVALQHVDPAVETVVAQNERFVTVEKTGRAGEEFEARAADA